MSAVSVLQGKLFKKQNDFCFGIFSIALFGIGLYLNLTKEFVLRLFKMAIIKKCSRLEQRSVIKFLVAEKCKQCEVYRRMCNVYGEAYFNKKKYGGAHGVMVIVVGNGHGDTSSNP